jgi:site-specific DNA recombinase
MDHLDFKIIRKEKEELISALENKLIKVSQSTVTIKTDLDQAIGALSNIDKLYREGDVKKKREIVSSIYPEKLIFDGIQYRTARLNEVAQILYMLDSVFSKKKRWTNRSKFRFVHFSTVSGNWFEHLAKLVESLLYVNHFKLPGLQ